MKTLISGGAKNGKSFFAQKKAKELAEELNVPLYYVATMIPHDEEDHARIQRHLEERAGWGFTTIERPRNLAGLFEDKNPGVFLVDSVTAILANEMFPPERDFDFDQEATFRVVEDFKAFSEKAENIVFVSDYIYGAAPEVSSADGDYTVEYMKGLAYVDRKLAAECDEVIEISAGIPIIHKQ